MATNAIRTSDSEKGWDGMEPVIDLIGLQFSWPKDPSPVLDIDEFVVRAGELLFIMGPSGSGKSTLLSILTGILTPQQGRVEILGQQLTGFKGSERDRFRADNIGYIFQMFNLIPYLSIVENVALPCQFSPRRRKNILARGTTVREESLRLLTQLNLSDPALLQKPVVELSVGQQQRVAAARALIGGPGLVIADEPTSSLDTAHRESFLRLLFDECSRSGATLIFVSHDNSLAPLFDRVIDFNGMNRGASQINGREL